MPQMLRASYDSGFAATVMCEGRGEEAAGPPHYPGTLGTDLPPGRALHNTCLGRYIQIS